MVEAPCSARQVVAHSVPLRRRCAPICSAMLPSSPLLLQRSSKGMVPAGDGKLARASALKRSVRLASASVSANVDCRHRLPSSRRNCTVTGAASGRIGSASVAAASASPLLHFHNTWSLASSARFHNDRRDSRAIRQPAAGAGGHCAAAYDDVARRLAAATTVFCHHDPCEFMRGHCVNRRDKDYRGFTPNCLRVFPHRYDRVSAVGRAPDRATPRRRSRPDRRPSAPECCAAAERIRAGRPRRE